MTETVSNLRASLAATHRRGRDLHARVTTAVFGDATGVALFFGVLVVVMLTWRLGTFINDTLTLGNTLAAVAEGHLDLQRVVYGDSFDAPGTHVRDGRIYGRNYGQAYLSLPALLLVEGIASVAALRVAIAAAWCLSLLACLVALRHRSARRPLLVGGSVLAVCLFGLQIAVATAIDPALHPLIALQVTAMVAAGLLAVLLYRLVTHLHGRRVGLFAGVTAGLATPVAFWAPLPKRHVFVALATVAVVYAVLRSRDPAAEHGLWFRAGAYGVVGYTTSILALDALLLFAPLLVVDLATAPRNDRRSLAVVAGAFCLSVVPFLVTNTLVTGSPVTPPRLLPDYGETAAELSAYGPGSTTAADPGSGGTIPGAFVAGKVLSFFAEGLAVLLGRPDRVFHTFLRSGYIESVASRDGGQAISLTVLESAPVLGALLVLPVLALRGGNGSLATVRDHLRTPTGAADALALAYVLAFAVFYVRMLPMFAQVTVRYLLPVYPLGVYGLARLPVVRRAIDRAPGTFWWTYAASVLLGGQLVVVALSMLEPGLGEAVQFHALLSLATATVVALWAVTASLSERLPDQLGGVALGLAAGAGTVFVLLAGLDYFDYAGEYALPLARVVTEAVSLV